MKNLTDWSVEPLNKDNPIYYKIVNSNGEQVVPFTWEDKIEPQKFCDAHNATERRAPQEWTVVTASDDNFYVEIKEGIRIACPFAFQKQAQAFADAHNAALAAERQAHKDTLTAAKHAKEFYERAKEQYQQQLAAERKLLVETLELAAIYVHRQHNNPKHTVSIYGPHLKQIDDALAKMKEPHV